MYAAGRGPDRPRRAAAQRGELRRRIGPGVELCPVLKADGYGHGAAHCAAAAIVAAGADRIAVATASEAVQIRAVDRDVPLLVLGALAPTEVDLAVSAGADVSVWDPDFVAGRSSAGRSRRRSRSGPRQVRHRHGAARQPRPGAGDRDRPLGRRPARTSSWRRSGPTSPPPTRPDRSFEISSATGWRSWRRGSAASSRR